MAAFHIYTARGSAAQRRTDAAPRRSSSAPDCPCGDPFARYKDRDPVTPEVACQARRRFFIAMTSPSRRVPRMMDSRSGAPHGTFAAAISTAPTGAERRELVAETPWRTKGHAGGWLLEAPVAVSRDPFVQSRGSAACWDERQLTRPSAQPLDSADAMPCPDLMAYCGLKA
jgi:hypothetical protein